jgi:hypothetical protein
MQSSHSTHITHCRYSNHQLPIMQFSHSTHITYCRYSKHQPSSFSPVTLLTLPTAGIQITNTHHAVQSLYSNYPLPVFKSPTLIMQSSHSTHITHCRYSNHQHLSCSPVTLLTLTTKHLNSSNPRDPSLSI